MVYSLAIFRPDIPELQPDWREVDHQPTLKELQEIVGGYI